MNAITQIAHTDAAVVGERKIDHTRGSLNSTVSNQWFSRPDDQRFLSLGDLYASVASRRDSSFEHLIEVDDLRFDASEYDGERLSISHKGGDELNPTHYSFGQICSLVKAPAPFLRSLHPKLTAENLQYCTLQRGEHRPLKFYGSREDNSLRAVTGPDYGRIYDAALVSAVQRIAGNGTGDTNWKVPGLMNWGKGTYNPYVDVTKETTTLYASDRDVFMFLVDDTHPISIGKLPNGDDDLIFRGFYAYNSEVGARSLGISTFWLRGVCQNRNLWGVEDFDTLRIVHSKHGNNRFVREAQPALRKYAESSPTKLLAGINAAKDAVVATDDEQRLKFLIEKVDISKQMAANVIETHEREEGRKPRSIFDFCQGLTAVARTIPNTDNRLEIEKVAGRLMNKAARNAV